MNLFNLKKKVEPDKTGPQQAATEKPEGKPTGVKPFEEGLVSTKDIIAPSALEVDSDFIKIGNKYFRTVFTVINRRFVEVNWLSSLINFDASQTIAMYVYPSDGKEILDDLRRKIAEMEAELTTDIQRGRVVNPATQAKLEDALNLQADLVKGIERFFQMGLYVTISSETKEELDKVTKNLEANMGSLMVLTKKATYQAEDGFITTLPICQDRLNITRNMDTTSLATTFPFVSSDLSDDRGVMYGINEHNGSLVIFDRFSMPNYNSVVFATAGAGKSYMIKLEAMRSLMLGTDIIVIDPENEYKDMCEAVGGQYIAFGYQEASKINPFDLALEGDDGENALNSKILNLHKMFKIMIGELDPIEESILDRAIMDAYKMKGITPDPETQKKEPPLIEDLYKSLIGMEEEKAKNLSARVEKYIKGSFAGIFNQKTTVNLKSNFVVFGIRNLEDALRPVAMHIILDYIWTVVKKELRRRILIVDEAWYLMQFPDSASFLRGIVKRGRKYYLGVTTITQDVDDFLATPFGKEIVTNSSIQILLKQHSAAIDQVGEVFYLSEGEKQLLLSADKGEGIFFAGQNHVAIRVVASEDEHKLITSNPEEVMRLKQLKIKLAEEIAPKLNVEPPTDTVQEQKPAVAEPLKSETPAPAETKQTEIPTIIQSTPVAEVKKEELIQSEAKIEEIKTENPIQPTNPQVIEIVEKEQPKETPESTPIPAETPPLPTTEKSEQKTENTESPQQEKRVLFETVPVTNMSAPVDKKEGIEDSLKQRIMEMENEERKKIEEHKKVEDEEKRRKEEEERKKKEEMEASLGKLPSYQELFKSTSKLPPLPPLPKFEPPKPMAVNNNPTKTANKPVFVEQPKEVKVPQPPQLAKKPTAVFEEKPKADSNKDDGSDSKKMGYDELFGNGIV